MSEKKKMCYCANCGKEVTCVSKAEEITANRIIGRKKYLAPLTAAVCTECGEIAKCPDLIRLGMKETEAYLGSIYEEDRQEYARLVATYFSPFEYLRRWRTENEVIAACLLCGCNEDNLTMEVVVPEGEECGEMPCEYLRNGDLLVPDDDIDTIELLENGPRMIVKHSDIYRVRGLFEPVAEVLLFLLYSARPELSDYDLKISHAAYLADTMVLNLLFGPKTRRLILPNGRPGYPLCVPYSNRMDVGCGINSGAVPVLCGRGSLHGRNISIFGSGEIFSDRRRIQIMQIVGVVLVTIGAILLFGGVVVALMGALICELFLAAISIIGNRATRKRYLEDRLLHNNDLPDRIWMAFFVCAMVSGICLGVGLFLYGSVVKALVCAAIVMALCLMRWICGNMKRRLLENIGYTVVN